MKRIPNVKRKIQFPAIKVGRYGRTRFWAIWLNGRLLAVVCYKKGATAIRDTLLWKNGL
jgi:hypothetical protein